jgi:hypothetical protein
MQDVSIAPFNRSAVALRRSPRSAIADEQKGIFRTRLPADSRSRFSPLDIVVAFDLKLGACRCFRSM